MTPRSERSLYAQTSSDLMLGDEIHIPGKGQVDLVRVTGFPSYNGGPELRFTADHHGVDGETRRIEFFGKPADPIPPDWVVVSQ
ncbi:hypothetical protein EON81_21075 [bacterium]|nr:MAG: hypothetical protein EON81_21075 [bacterium]